MTAKELYLVALELTGANDDDVFELNDVSDRLISIVNTVYAEIFYANHSDGFEPIVNEDDILNLSQNEIYDCAVYGVAAYIQNILGSSYDYEVFERIYNLKKKKLKTKCTITTVDDTFVRGSDF